MRPLTLTLLAAAAVSVQSTCTFVAQTQFYPNFDQWTDLRVSTGSGATEKHQWCSGELRGRVGFDPCDAGGIFDGKIDLVVTAFPNAYRDATLDTVCTYLSSHLNNLESAQNTDRRTEIHFTSRGVQYSAGGLSETTVECSFPKKKYTVNGDETQTGWGVIVETECTIPC